MKPLPGHTVQYASQMNRDRTFTLTVECSCGRTFGIRIVPEDTAEERALLWVKAAALVGDHLSKLKAVQRESLNPS